MTTSTEETTEGTTSTTEYTSTTTTNPNRWNGEIATFLVLKF